MALSAFDDKSQEPKMADLEDTLGRSVAHWKSLVSHIEETFPPLEKIWGFAGDKWGWSLRLKQKKRVILYMTPCRKHFLVGFVFGEKAVKAARGCPLPDSILAVIDEAPKYGEGYGFRIEVRTKRELEAVKELASVKMAR